ncbi:hypothetical protein AncyloWKF20_19465 [Ancylobacter sp. WKF20]|uniref:hypothetical protein n=1 Tax=Ancylobacter sp. WKF20 TaxID=3039801 RepID=UPI00243416D0|nr:hypothetical protein [Ancylobacter sp. WKF20]WGD29902.1 hypothetical protein AncyloWKF20_19465 [Ancylobacter sp. WKF20]
MSNVIPFPARVREPEPDDFDIDLFTAVDVAIRDLRDIAQRLRGDVTGQEQAEECMLMLARALESARLSG